jgi:hypothetical protein
MTISSLLPATPDTMRDFRQEIMVDLAALTKNTLSRKIAEQLPKNTGTRVSFVAAFEALRLFREITQKDAAHFSDAERTQLAEIEVEWCLDILGKLQRDIKRDSEQ